MRRARTSPHRLLRRLATVAAAVALSIPLLAVPSVASAAISPGITVEVVRANGTGLASVPVTVGGETGLTDSTGAIAFTNLTDGQAYQVEVALSSKFVAVASRLAVAAAVAPRVRFTAAIGASVSGRYQTSKGQPATGLVRAVSRAGAPVREVLTDSRGRYRIAGIPSGTYRVQFVPALLENVAPKYTRSFYGSKTEPGARWITVRQQRATAGASALTGINGTAYTGRLLTITSTTPMLSAALLGSSYVSTYSSGPENDNSITLRVPAGDYRVQAFFLDNSAAREFWYSARGATAGGVNMVNSPILSTVVRVGSTNRTIALVPPIE